jgi:hypothetical protein
MQRVLKTIFLIDEKLENNLKFWVLSGPYLLFLSIALATFDLAIFTAASFFLCYRFKFKGLIVSLLALTAYSFYLQINFEEKHLWNLGLQISIALGLIISTLGFEEIKKYLSSQNMDKGKSLSDLQKHLQESQIQVEASNKNLEENLILLKTELNKKSQKLAQTSQENENLKKDLQDNVNRKDYLLNELDSKVKEIDELHIKQDELYEKISFLKDEEFLYEKNKNYQKEIEELKNLHLVYKNEKDLVCKELNEKKQEIEKLLFQISDRSNTENFENKIKEKEKEILSLQEKLKAQPKIKKDISSPDMNEYKNSMKEFHNLNSLYIQLKNQFEEKQQILDKTRQELFQVKEKLTGYQREQNKDFEFISENEKIILSELDQTVADLQNYKNESELLEEMITFLINKKR